MKPTATTFSALSLILASLAAPGALANPCDLAPNDTINCTIRKGDFPFVGVDDSKYQVSNPAILAREGSPLAMLEDAVNQALIRLSSVTRTSPKAVCFDLASVVPSLEQVVRSAADAHAETDRKFSSFGAHRLEIWKAKPAEFCKSGKFYTTSGKVEKATYQGLECYLVLIERDLKVTKAEIAKYLERDSKDATDVWNDYSERLARACK